MFTNVTVASIADAQTNIYGNIEQPGLSSMGNVRSGAYALRLSSLAAAQGVTGYNEIRIKCEKPYLEYQVDVVLNYVTEIITSNPTAEREVSSNEYRFLPEDTSQTQFTGVFKKHVNAHLYSHAFYMPNKYHVIITATNRWECGDYDAAQPAGKTYSPIGNWQFFYR